jgi:superfamily II DNA or RNA helicase
VLCSLGEVNRLLVVFPTDAQLIQFEESAASSMEKCCIEKPLEVCDIRFFGAEAIKKHQSNKCKIYAITVQSLIGARGMDNVLTLLSKGRWMVVVDEYHHYGIDLPFGKAVNALSCEFMLCMSATPYRPSEDSAFGVPGVAVTYRDAVEEHAVKPLRAHSYNYKIDAVTEDNEIISFTTEDVIAEAGSDNPKSIEKMIYDRKLRWSPKYISPLVSNPLSRMIVERVRTGYRLQAIIGAMCVSHAEMVCDQVRSTFPELACDWVGTGDDGKSVDENRKVLKRFAPTDGTQPKLDVLVHVGMAGEGLDTVLVSEVIHLNAASVNNTNNQENGRAARYLPGVTGNINFDAGSGYAKQGYIGESIMDAMDNMPPSPESGDEESRSKEPKSDLWELPEQPNIRIVNAECISIDSGDVEVKQMATQLQMLVEGFTKDDLADTTSELWKHAIEGVKMMRKQDAEIHNERSVVLQWEEAMNGALTTVTGNTMKQFNKNGTRFDKAMLGDIKKRINTAKKRSLGQAEKNVDSLQKHYNWLTRLNQQIVNGDVPLWLR